MRLLSLILLLMLVGPLGAQAVPKAVVHPAEAAPAPSITIPLTFNVEGPGLVVVRPTAITGEATWSSLDAGLQLIPQELLAARNVAVGVAMKPGSYRLSVRVVAHGQRSATVADSLTITVVVGNGGVAPVPPPPAPPKQVVMPPPPVIPPPPPIPIRGCAISTPQITRPSNPDRIEVLLRESRAALDRGKVYLRRLD